MWVLISLGAVCGGRHYPVGDQPGGRLRNLGSMLFRAVIFFRDPFLYCVAVLFDWSAHVFYKKKGRHWQ